MKTEHEELVEIVNRGRASSLGGKGRNIGGEIMVVLVLTKEQFDRLNQITMWGQYDPREDKAE